MKNTIGTQCSQCCMNISLISNCNRERVCNMKNNEELPASDGSTMIGSSSSSDTKTAHTEELYREFTWRIVNKDQRIIRNEKVQITYSIKYLKEDESIPSCHSIERPVSSDCHRLHSRNQRIHLWIISRRDY